MRRRLTAVALALCLSGALAACSGSGTGLPSADSSGFALPTQLASPSATGAAPGSSSTRTPSTEAAALALRASHSTSTLRSAYLSMTSVVGATRTTVTGWVGYHPVRMDVTISIKQYRIREVLVGKTLYLKLPGSNTGRAWRSISLSQLSEFSGIDLASLINSANADPTVRMLTRASDLRVVGVEKVGGVRTRHLAGTVDLDAVFAAMPASEQAAATTLRDMMDELGVTDDRIELWVNDDDIPVKVVQSYRSSLGPGHSTMYLTHLNARTSITAPPRSQVAPFTG